MTPSMHERVADWFEDSGLTDGLTVQMLRWKDSGDKDEAFIVFRPNGGTDITHEAGAEYYILADVIGRVGEDKEIDDRVQKIISFVKENSMPSDCIGRIDNMGGISTPVVTQEDRLVYRLQFAVIYGE